MRNCGKGDECQYLHEGKQIRYDDIICKFYRGGYCTTIDCPYSHDLSQEGCSNMISHGSCPYNEKCRFSHNKEVIEKQIQKNIKESMNITEEAKI